jgi:peptide/nickel transport system substrate-binding protein
LERSYFKYIFVVVVFILVIFTTYQFVKDKNTIDDTDLDQTSTVSTIQKDLRLAIAEMDTINPIVSNNRNVQEISKIIFEPLVTLDGNYKMEYCLAEEIAKQDDTTYLVKLRQGVKWHDLTEFTTEDVRFTIDSIKKGVVSSIYAENLKYVDSIEVIDKYTMKIYLSQEVPYFEYYLTVPIMCQSYYDGTDLNNEDKNISPVGTGLFQISSVNGNVIKLTRNDNYWNKDKVTMAEEIVITNYSTMGEVYNSFKSGDIDLITVTASNIEDYIGTMGYNKIEYKARNYDFIAFNTTDSLFSSQAVRKAISLAIDKNSIVASLGSGYTVSNFSLDMGNWLYTKDLNVTTNTDEAKQILEQDGWTYRNNTWQKTVDGETKKLSFTITVNENNDERVKAAESIAQQLANIGISVNVKKVSSNNYQNALNNKDFECIIAGIETGFTPSLDTFFGDNNIANYYNEELQNLLNNAKNSNDEAEMHRDYERIFDIYLEEAPYIGLYRNTETIVCDQGLVGNITPNTFNIYHNIDKWYRQ